VFRDLCSNLFLTTIMIEGIDELLVGCGASELCELRSLLGELLGAGRLIEQQRLTVRDQRFVYRLRFEIGGTVRSLIVKRYTPEIARRNQLVATRWLPGIGLAQHGPPLLGVAAERRGEGVWHVLDDLGDCTLRRSEGGSEPGRAAIRVIARLHTAFAGHRLLAECRLWGSSLGISFYTCNARDAIAALDALRSPNIELTPARVALRDRLVARLCTLLDEQPWRARVSAECGGAETLVHGDFIPTNTLVVRAAQGLHVRLIDWDHAGVGLASYDLSLFLSYFAPHERPGLLDVYQEYAGGLPPRAELNVLFDTAQQARLANRVIWPALAALEGHADWAFEELANVNDWFEMWEPVLPA
jgi:phosphotransferase family enzyme